MKENSSEAQSTTPKRRKIVRFLSGDFELGTTWEDRSQPQVISLIPSFVPIPIPANVPSPTSSPPLNDVLGSEPPFDPCTVAMIDEQHGPIASTLVDNNNLCLILKSSGQSVDCKPPYKRQLRLGTILDHEGYQHTVLKPNVPCAPRHIFDNFPMRTISLGKMISHPENKPSNPLLTRVERLMLGVRLASSVLQLHDTHWLDETWGKNDIIFLLDHNDRPLLEMPMVGLCFSPDSCKDRDIKSYNQSNNRVGNHIMEGNKTLLSLGIVLLELWFWKDLDAGDTSTAISTLPDPNSQPQSKHIPTISAFRDKRANAEQHLDHLSVDALPPYSHAVKVCIHGLTHLHETSLSDDNFMAEAYRLIVNPLEEFLEYHTRKLD